MSHKGSSASSQDNLPPAVANACRAIAAFLTKLEHAADKIIQYKLSVGQHIAAIKKERPGDWQAIVKAECGLGRSQAYKFIALVNGTETVEEQRAKNRERVARHRSPLRNGQNPPRPDLQAHINEPARDDIGPGSGAEVELPR